MKSLQPTLNPTPYLRQFPKEILKRSASRLTVSSLFCINIFFFNFLNCFVPRKSILHSLLLAPSDEGWGRNITLLFSFLNKMFWSYCYLRRCSGSFCFSASLDLEIFDICSRCHEDVEAESLYRMESRLP